MKNEGFYLGQSSSCLLHLLSRTENNLEWREQYQPDDEDSKNLFVLSALHKRHTVSLCKEKNSYCSTDICSGLTCSNFWEHMVVKVTPKRN